MKERMDWTDIARYFYLPDERLQAISRDFSADIDRALAGEAGATVSAEKSYASLPEGDETGVFLALDFGGTNVRASRIRLLGRHCYIIEKKVSRPLKVAGEYDYLSSSTTAVKLFDFLARLVGKVARRGQSYRLGHAFSFALERTGIEDGRLLAWSKEIAVSGVEGENVNALLKAALVRQGLCDIEPVALVNDTTALLLSASYTMDKVRVGMVCGTGFNACYYEPEWKMIVNLEAGDYNGVTGHHWDEAVDAGSSQPGLHKLEKMMSGAYASELFRQTLLTYFGVQELPPFTTEAMNAILRSEDDQQGRLTMGKLWNRIVRLEDVRPVRHIGASIFVRSAQLVGAVGCGILHHLYKERPIPNQTIAIDGSVLKYVRGALVMMEDAMQACQNEGPGREKQISGDPILIQDGVSVGAAIAAAMSIR